MVSGVDDILVLGEKIDVDQVKVDLQEAFICKCEGTVKEYMGNKIDLSWNNDGLGVAKFTQLVLVQKLEDEFELSSGKPPRTPAVAGQVLARGNGRAPLDSKEMKKYQSGTALCLYKMQWS